MLKIKRKGIPLAFAKRAAFVILVNEILDLRLLLLFEILAELQLLTLLAFLINLTLMISWNDFDKIDMRVGTIIEVNDFPKARKPSFQLRIDFGPQIGIKKSSAQITIHYQKDDLLNRQVIAVINFPPKQIADFISECLVLGIYDEQNDVVLLKPDKPLGNGLKIG